MKNVLLRLSGIVADVLADIGYFIQSSPIAFLGVVAAIGSWVVGMNMALETASGAKYSLVEYLTQIADWLPVLTGLALIVGSVIIITGYIVRSVKAVKYSSFVVGLVWVLTSFVYLLAQDYDFFFNVGVSNAVFILFLAYLFSKDVDTT